MAAEEPLDAAARVAAAAAHEFNNHVTAIALQAELALASPVVADEKLRRRLDGILRSCEAARALTGGPLAFGGQRILEPERVDVRAAVARTAVPVAAPADDVPLVVEVDPNILADALAALSAVAGDGTVSLSGNDDVVELRFSGHRLEDDEGEEAFRRFFEPFAREAKELGLAAVYGFVRQSGGTIGFERVPGGADIVLRLPCVAGDIARGDRRGSGRHLREQRHVPEQHPPGAAPPKGREAP